VPTPGGSAKAETPETARRILLVTDAYPPSIGGADRAVQLLAQELVDRGHAVEVASAWQPAMSEGGLDGAVWVHRVRDLTTRIGFASADPYRHVPPPFPDPEAAARLRRIVKRFRPDLVQSYGWISHSCALALVGLDVPLVLSVRDYGNFCAVRTLVRDGAVCGGPELKKCLRCASRFYGAPKGAVAVGGVFGSRSLLRRTVAGLHFNSTYTRERAHHDLFQDAQPTLPEAVIGTFRDDARDEPPDPDILAKLPDEPFILFVGALRRVKGVEVLLAAYRRLVDPPPLVLIGTREIDSPAEYPRGVRVIESVPHGTVMAAWERAMFGVFPSLWAEPFGNVLHEAMSRGCAVIGTTPGGHRDIVLDRVTGLLVPSGKTQALTDAMAELVGDPALRHRLGAAARQHSELFTAKHAMPAFERLYDEVIGTYGRDG
jgi:glycosyltransferase involved in cell wall biosynthesis